jgi:hypothetical protein
MWTKSIAIAAMVILGSGCAVKGPYPKQYAEGSVVLVATSSAPMRLLLDGTYLFAPESVRSGANVIGGILLGVPGALIGAAIDAAGAPKQMQVALPFDTLSLTRTRVRNELDKHASLKSMVVSSDRVSHSIGLTVLPHLLANIDQTTSLGLRFQTRYRVGGEAMVFDANGKITEKFAYRDYDWISAETTPGALGEGWNANNGAALIDALNKALDVFLPVMFDEIREGKLVDSTENAKIIRLADNLAIERIMAPCLGFIRTLGTHDLYIGDSGPRCYRTSGQMLLPRNRFTLAPPPQPVSR